MVCSWSALPPLCEASNPRAANLSRPCNYLDKVTHFAATRGALREEMRTRGNSRCSKGWGGDGVHGEVCTASIGIEAMEVKPEYDACRNEGSSSSQEVVMMLVSFAYARRVRPDSQFVSTHQLT